MAKVLILSCRHMSIQKKSIFNVAENVTFVGVSKFFVELYSTLWLLLTKCFVTN